MTGKMANKEQLGKQHYISSSRNKYLQGSPHQYPIIPLFKELLDQALKLKSNRNVIKMVTGIVASTSIVNKFIIIADM
jgi:hypothetical protein